MTDFLFLFRGGRPEQAGLSPDQMQAHLQKWGTWIQELTKSGNFKSGDPLDSTGKVVTGKNKTVTDGPYAEAKDLVGGYLLISAETLEHATELAHGCPIFETDGAVEVRQIARM